MVMFRRKDKDKEEKGKKGEKRNQDWFYADYLLKNLEALDEYTNHYLIVADKSMVMKGHCFTNLSKVLNVLAQKGWRLVDYQITGVTNILIGHAILEKE